jgi:hypothetical protein
MVDFEKLKLNSRLVQVASLSKQGLELRPERGSVTRSRYEKQHACEPIEAYRSLDVAAAGDGCAPKRQW